MSAIKKHRFFRKIDWQALGRRELEPPIVPIIVSCNGCMKLMKSKGITNVVILFWCQKKIRLTPRLQR